MSSVCAGLQRFASTVPTTKGLQQHRADFIQSSPGDPEPEWNNAKFLMRQLFLAALFPIPRSDSCCCRSCWTIDTERAISCFPSVAPVQSWKWAEKLFVVPLLFWALQVQLVVLESAFVMVSTVWPFSCLLLFYLGCRLCPTICKSGGGTCPRALWSRRYCFPTKLSHCLKTETHVHERLARAIQLDRAVGDKWTRDQLIASLSR